LHHGLASGGGGGNINVLILGETGVGKEDLAEPCTGMSPRAKAPFLCLNCAALRRDLLESELFGYERGAFTGACTPSPVCWRPRRADVFLDEIGEMSLGLQAKLLRVIETAQVTRVGGVKPAPIDVRFVAATNRDLASEIERRAFRRTSTSGSTASPCSSPAARAPLEILPLAPAFVQQLAAQTGVSRRPRWRRGRGPAGGVRLARQHPRAAQRDGAGAAAVCGRRDLRRAPAGRDHERQQPAAGGPSDACWPASPPPPSRWPAAIPPASATASCARWPPARATRAAPPRCWAWPAAPSSSALNQYQLPRRAGDVALSHTAGTGCPKRADSSSARPPPLAPRRLFCARYGPCCCGGSARRR
jgi:hypothetical protein